MFAGNAPRGHGGLVLCFRMTQAQKDTLRTFAYETLQGGALRFTHAQPGTSEQVEMRIVPQGEDLYSDRPVGSRQWWDVSMVLE